MRASRGADTATNDSMRGGAGGPWTLHPPLAKSTAGLESVGATKAAIAEAKGLDPLACGKVGRGERALASPGALKRWGWALASSESRPAFMVVNH